MRKGLNDAPANAGSANYASARGAHMTGPTAYLLTHRQAWKITPVSVDFSRVSRYLTIAYEFYVPWKGKTLQNPEHKDIDSLRNIHIFQAHLRSDPTGTLLYHIAPKPALLMEYEGKFYSELYCQELGVSIATNLVSRLFNSLNIVISAVSLVLLFDVAIRHRRRFICHVSLTLLIYNLFISSIAHALVYVIAQVRYLTLSFTFTTPCSLFIPKNEYAIVQIAFTYSIIWMENIQYALLIERVVASVFVEWYETATSFLGWLLSLCCIALTLTKVTYFFWHESFSVPTVNGLSKPATLVELMNSFFIFSIATNGISLVVCAALYTVNKRENTRRTFKLPCRFRSEENVSSVFLVGGILATHSCVFLFYRCSYLLTNVIATTPHELEVYRSASHVLPLSPLLLGILTIWYFRKVRRTRKMRISTMVSMQANGADGWNNYASVLESQWNRP